MKKILAFALLVAMTLLCFSSFAVMAEQENTASEEELKEIGDITSCQYDAEKEEIGISGSIQHEVMVSYDKHTISLYRIPYGKDVMSVISDAETEPLATSAISVRFEFTVDVKSAEELFSQYAVVIDEEGDAGRLISHPRYPTVPSTYTYEKGDRDAFKGIASEYDNLAADAGASVSVIPVYLEKLLNLSFAGHLYVLGDTYLYFDKNYIASLDQQIRGLSAAGSRVYLQLMLTDGSGQTVAVYDGAPATTDAYLPNMNHVETARLIYAFSDFLADRYSNRVNGTLAGLIVGSGVEEASSMWSGMMATDAYAKAYAHYMNAWAVPARVHLPELDVVIPLSASQYETSNGETKTVKASTDRFLRDVYDFLKMRFTLPYSTSLLVESNMVPLGLSAQSLKDGTYGTIPSLILSADNLQEFSQYLDSLSATQALAPDSYMYVWNVSEEIGGNVLSCAYAYSYLKLLGDDHIRSFTVSFLACERGANPAVLSSMLHLIKEIDTEQTEHVTEPHKKLLGIESWDELIESAYTGASQNRTVISVQPLAQLPDNLLGSYSYFDFSYQSGVSTWYAGANCDSLKIDYNDVSGRALQAHFNGALRVPMDYSEILCYYEFPENFVYTPYMSFRFNVTEDAAIKDAEKNEADGASAEGEETVTAKPLYEVKITVGSEDTVIETRVVVAAQEDKTCTINLEAFSHLAMADSIRIGVRCLTGESSGYSLNFSSMIGHSSQHVSSELDALISQERLRIRNLSNESESDSSNAINTVLTVLGVMAVFVVIGIGVFMCFRREEPTEKEQ